MEKGNHVARNNSDNSLQFQRSKATAFPSQGNAWLPCLSGSKIPHMRRYVLFLAILFAALTTLRCAVVEESFAQAAAGPGAAQSGVVLVKLFGPVYPPIARTAGIKGEVVLALGIRRDGSVESANVVSGPPLLQQAAMDSAQQSQFECRGCGEAVTPYSIVYTFQLDSTEQKGQYFPKVTQLQNHITLIDRPPCLCDPSPTVIRKARAAKCLYLWRCGTR